MSMRGKEEGENEDEGECECEGEGAGEGHKLAYVAQGHRERHVRDATCTHKWTSRVECFVRCNHAWGWSMGARPPADVRG